MPFNKIKIILCALAFLLLLPLASGCARDSDLNGAIRDAAGLHRFRLLSWEIQTLGAKLVSINSSVNSDNTTVNTRLLEERVREAFIEQGIYNPADRFFNIKVSFPPVYAYIGEPPHILIVSPRDRIENIGEATLRQGITIEDREDIETQMESFGYSAVVDDLGGLSTFPSFITGDADIRFIIDTIAHEWMHHYLFFTPLGFIKMLDTVGLRQDYDVSTMNETVADIVGREIGRIVYEKYYAPPVETRTTVPVPPPDTGGTGFDFNKEMREIRLAVDDFLSKGLIDEAEDFMNEKRKYLEDNGYYIRKLNQAYFAFHGTYADSPTSVSPIGEELRTLRAQSASLKDFLNTVSAMSSRRDLSESVR